MVSLRRRLFAEFLGCLFLAATVVGSGIAAQTLSPHDVGLQLTENALATALALFVLIAVLAPISGAHFNPIISIVDAALGRRPWRDVPGYAAVQVIGCAAGVMLANLMFGHPAVSISGHARLSPAHLLAEVVATAGLVMIVFVLARFDRERLAPAAVAAYIGAAYLFTSSTSFANPAITVARIASNTFAGIDPASAAGFIVAQLAGGVAGYLLVRALVPAQTRAPALDQEGARRGRVKPS
ncbi:MAG TPA: MIP/aquaporin family protein [Pseudolysinimonas sp.]|nr:MIP/aquaporin family protein [Pseudolysinimonas sp.]